MSIKQQLAVGFIPYEIGDDVVMKDSIVVRKITDIKMTQYLKDKKVEFEVQLDDKVWVAAELIKERLVV